MLLFRIRFRIWHLLSLVTLIAIMLGLTTQLGYQTAEIEIVEFRDSFGQLEVTVRTKYKYGGGAGSMHLPYKMSSADVEELVGAKIQTRFRTSHILWMAPNQIDVTRAEVCLAIDKLVARIKTMH
jgi:hypothetical protein